MRVAFTIAYNGTHYLGSQTQTQTNNTILGVVEKTFKQLGVNSKIVASGRTDKGVHASGQVCHVDLPLFWNDLVKLKRVCNQMLPSSIVINSIHTESDDFHARYSAKKRTYRYIMKNAKSNPFDSDFITYIQSIDFQTVVKNIKLFEGNHDFAHFMKTGSDVNSTTREIFCTQAYQYKDYIILKFQANGFLRSQIRLMVGALLQLSQEQIIDQLQGTKIHKIRPAPANGLYLAKIHY